jgi:O-antigen biosynthesis protein
MPRPASTPRNVHARKDFDPLDSYFWKWVWRLAVPLKARYPIRLERPPDIRYSIWAAAREQSAPRESTFDATPPRFHLVCPIEAGITLEQVNVSIQSMLAQSVPAWALTLVGRQTSAAIDELVTRDPRIEVRAWRDADDLYRVMREGIAPYVGLLRAGDVLAPQALFAAMQSIKPYPKSDLLYSDEDRLDSHWRRHDPFFKPNWSPELMLSTNYIGSLCLIRRVLIGEIDSPVFTDVEAYWWDICLKVATLARYIHHIPEVLYHATPVLRDTTHTPDVIRDHLRRQGRICPDVSVDRNGQLRVRWSLRQEPLISIIIPTRDQSELLGECLQSLFEITEYPHFEVILVDTGSSEPQTEQLYQRYESEQRLSIVNYTEAFNFSKACNLGARAAQGRLLLFLNNDMLIADADWLHLIAQWFEDEQVGIVGAALLYPDGTLQHGGVLVSMGGMADHLFRAESETFESPFGRAGWYRNLSAVTGACLMISREVFQTVGGFDEGFILNYSDIDLCLRVRQRGCRVVYTPDVRLVHYESSTHARIIPRQDFEYASQRWNTWGIFEGDPYFNPHLSCMNTTPSVLTTSIDDPVRLHRDLMQRLPSKSHLTLPDDLKSRLPYRLRARMIRK